MCVLFVRGVEDEKSLSEVRRCPGSCGCLCEDEGGNFFFFGILGWW